MLRSDQVAAFDRTIAFLKKQNYQTILIQAPVTDVVHHSFENNKEIDHFFQSYGIDYYNTNTSRIGSSYGCFYDRDHLNINGVMQFNQLVLNIIKIRRYLD